MFPEITLAELKEKLTIEYFNGYASTKTEDINDDQNLIGKKMLYGSPGIGKTQAVYQVAKELANMLGKKFIDLNKLSHKELLQLLEEIEKPENRKKYFIFKDLTATHLQPEDLCIPGGLLQDDKGHFTQKVPAWVILFQYCPGILFIDEITNVKREDVKTALFKIIDEGKIGGVSINRNVMIIAAGNNSRESSVAEDLPLPLVNRMEVNEVKGPTGKEWAQYAVQKFPNIPRDIIIFLSHFVDDYVQEGLDVDRILAQPEEKRSFTTPRSLFMLLDTFEKLGGNQIFKSKNIETMEEKTKKIVNYMSRGRIIDLSHQALFNNYLLNRVKILKLLENDNLDASTKLAAAVLLGEEMRQHALYSKFETKNKNKDFDSDSENKAFSLIPLQDIPKYLNKIVSENKEFINLFFFGLGILEKRTKLSDTFKITTFAYEIINQNNPHEAQKIAQKNSEINIIAKIINSTDSKSYSFDIKDLFNQPKNKLAQDTLDHLVYSFSAKISMTLELLKEYMIHKTNTKSYEFSKITHELSRILHEEDLKEIEAIINKKTQQKMEKLLNAI